MNHWQPPFWSSSFLHSKIPEQKKGLLAGPHKGWNGWISQPLCDPFFLNVLFLESKFNELHSQKLASKAWWFLVSILVFWGAGFHEIGSQPFCLRSHIEEFVFLRSFSSTESGATRFPIDYLTNSMIWLWNSWNIIPKASSPISDKSLYIVSNCILHILEDEDVPCSHHL